jgi:RNA polymerase sigma-70 factor, ECF subfamily
MPTKPTSSEGSRGGRATASHSEVGAGKSIAESSTDLIQRWRTGDESAATELYRRYVQELLRVIGVHLSRRMKARLDADDVCQSVFRTVFRRARQGEFAFQDDDDVWKLLVTIALNKLRNKHRYMAASKRSVDRETPSGDLGHVDAFTARQLGRSPGSEEAALVAEVWDSVLTGLPCECQELLRLRVEGYSQQEIAEELRVSTRTIRRMNEQIRKHVSAMLRDDRAEPQ